MHRPHRGQADGKEDSDARLYRREDGGGVVSSFIITLPGNNTLGLFMHSAKSPQDKYLSCAAAVNARLTQLSDYS